MKELNKTLLIICEGKKSEPNYFNNLRNEIINQNIKDVHIKILPIPEEEQEKILADVKNFEPRRGAKRRVLRAPINPSILDDDYVIEDKYKAQPISYIRKAQLAYDKEGFDELWAVYDKDGHPHHREAYELANNIEICNEKVNIGFSSIAFEFWILLHFEYSNTTFLKSQCRINRNTIDCGTENGDVNNCNGNKCVVGRINSKQYLKYNKDKHYDYEEFSNNIHLAFKNALRVRETQSENIHFYEKNPYITIDRLVFKLYYFHVTDHEWINTRDFILIDNLNIKINVDNGKCIVCVYNNSNSTAILNKETICFINVEYNILLANERKILQGYEEYCIDFDIDVFDYLIFNRNEIRSFILDRPFIKSNIYL